MNLETLRGDNVTRPTSLRVKEAMFSAIQFQVAGARVLDLFSGSGQLGIEALSRGAKHCVFVDQSRDACDVIKRNLKKTGFFQNSVVTSGNAERYLDYCKDSFDVALVDPPYNTGAIEKVLPLLETVISPNGFVICESESGLELPEGVGTLALKKRYRHGTTTVWLYRKAVSED